MLVLGDCHFGYPCWNDAVWGSNRDIDNKVTYTLEKKHCERQWLKIIRLLYKINAVYIASFEHDLT